MFTYEKNKLSNYIGELLYSKLRKYNAIIAGGSVTSIFTNSAINDLDVYFKCKEDAASFLIDVGDGHFILAKTDKAMLFTYNEIKVQAIYFRYFQSAEEIFQTFDFTVCMGAYDFAEEKFILHDDFLKHNAQRLLKFNNGTAFPIISALRVQKYNSKGYYISRTEFVKIMLTVLDLHIDNFDDLKEQIGGMYGENYDEILNGTECEEFNIKNIVDGISEKQNECVDFKKSEPISFEGDFTKYICDIFGIEEPKTEYEEPIDLEDPFR